ncbi:unnamed protein product [Candidula unifasciata]|uniref:Origin recognition complex subunit 3 n=1 Tax=Candidula unifasciata TaxID=100452 RepID=A0A8S3Z2W4_9EUPU|nr:unnamed protein product [Candidula unifasciata]
MLEDAENLNPLVLQDFISLCSSHLDSLPVILVLGIATSLTVIHQLLPTSVSSLLCIETFQAPSASSYLTQLMDKIIMTPDIPFRLGPKVFHFLLDVFLYHDFSILNFIMGFEYSMAEHFLSNPLSLLCCPRSDIDMVVSRLTHVQLEDIRRQPAFMRYVEDKSADYQAILLTDDSATKKLLTEELTVVHVSHAKMFTTLRFLHSLCSGLPKHPLGKQLRELYSVCLTQELCKSEGYEQAFNLLRMMSCDDLSQLLNVSLKTLSEARDEDIGRLHKDVESFIYRLQHIDEEPDDEKTGSENMPDAGRVLPKRAKLHELKEKLQSLTTCRRMSPYERLRNTVLDTLHKHLSLLLVCPLSRPLHEIFYFNNLSAIRDQIRATPRCTIQHALTQPGKYLNCPCCQCEADAILPSMPDICIVYKLHLECGTLVNLYDWLQAFVTVISSKETGVGKKVERNSKPSTELRARFIRAVSELQFLGFIKATQRKTDHVTRLTW